MTFIEAKHFMYISNNVIFYDIDLCKTSEVLINYKY